MKVNDLSDAIKNIQTARESLQAINSLFDGYKDELRSEICEAEEADKEEKVEELEALHDIVDDVIGNLDAADTELQDAIDSAKGLL